MSKRVKKNFTSDVSISEPYNRTLRRNPQHLRPRSANQHAYLKYLQDDDKNIVFAIGPAGSGKTMFAVHHGIKMYQDGKVDKIVVTRPAVSVDEDLGFLPGTLNEKMAPWTRPIFDVFAEYYSQRDIAQMLDDGIIEISPLAYMRGRNFMNSYIIFDESQNSTPSQMKMVLTRIAEGSKLIITGDLAQADRMQSNGLLDFIKRLAVSNSTRIGVIEFDHADIQRHPAVIDVLRVYGEDD